MKLSCRWGTIDMGSINCAEYIAKVRPPLGIVPDLLGREVICCWEVHISCVEFGRGENVEDLSKVAASTSLACFNSEKK
jgi:hypothetical protein